MVELAIFALFLGITQSHFHIVEDVDLIHAVGIGFATEFIANRHDGVFEFIGLDGVEVRFGEHAVGCRSEIIKGHAFLCVGLIIEECAERRVMDCSLAAFAVFLSVAGQAHQRNGKDEETEDKREDAEPEGYRAQRFLKLWIHDEGRVFGI